MQNNKWLDEILLLTKQLMAIPSISPNVADENQCADAIRHFTLAPYEDSKTPEVFADFWLAEDGRKNFTCLLRSKKQRIKR